MLLCIAIYILAKANGMEIPVICYVLFVFHIIFKINYKED